MRLVLIVLVSALVAGCAALETDQFNRVYISRR